MGSSLGAAEDHLRNPARRRAAFSSGRTRTLSLPLRLQPLRPQQHHRQRPQLAQSAPPLGLPGRWGRFSVAAQPPSASPALPAPHPVGPRPEDPPRLVIALGRGSPFLSGFRVFSFCNEKEEGELYEVNNNENKFLHFRGQSKLVKQQRQPQKAPCAKSTVHIPTKVRVGGVEPCFLRGGRVPGVSKETLRPPPFLLPYWEHRMALRSFLLFREHTGDTAPGHCWWS